MNIKCVGSPRVKSVSYTHLDVYKRQASALVGKEVVGQAAKNVLAKGMRTNMVTGGIMMAVQTVPDAVKPVSYTHLDVYKRQQLRLLEMDILHLRKKCTPEQMLDFIDGSCIRLEQFYGCLLYTSRCV